MKHIKAIHNKTSNKSWCDKLNRGSILSIKLIFLHYTRQNKTQETLYTENLYTETHQSHRQQTSTKRQS